jgi:xanthine phosphoribosyltransferase
MKLLEERILTEGKHLGGGILKVDSFMNHQIDPELMREIGSEFAVCFEDYKPTKILTAETSGIAPALACAMFINVPLVFARKHKPITMSDDAYIEATQSPTHGKNVELIVSPDYLKKEDRILIIDDFLASAKTIMALVNLVEKSGAKLIGIGAVIEKAFSKGREALLQLEIPVEALATIERFDGDKIILKEKDEAACH